jgi:ribosomal protein S18 acetylase RimI-like enzyme
MSRFDSRGGSTSIKVRTEHPYRRCTGRSPRVSAQNTKAHGGHGRRFIIDLPFRASPVNGKTLDGQEPSMSVTIRTAVLGDEQRLTVINGFVQDLHVAKRPDSFKPSTKDEVVEWFSLLLKNTSARIWIAEEGGTAIGYVLTMVQERPENPFCRSRRWYEIDQIAVDPGHRRKGVASALIQKALTEAAADGFAEIELCTWSFNVEAQSLVRKFGFEPKFLRWHRKREIR